VAQAKGTSKGSSQGGGSSVIASELGQRDSRARRTPQPGRRRAARMNAHGPVPQTPLALVPLLQLRAEAPAVRPVRPERRASVQGMGF
jgi:hypothetical protein